MMWLSDETLVHLRTVADQPDLAGTRYIALEPIGRGGMGTVYRARDTQLERDVALKVLRAPELDPGLARRLADEARILAGLEHPGIVPVHDVGTLPDGRVFYAMKLVRGMRLDRVAAEDIDQNQRLRIFQRICEAVAFAHAHGVLHRDLKPGNIMVGAFGEVLVMDWGVARRTTVGPVAGGHTRTAVPQAPDSAGSHTTGTVGPGTSGDNVNEHGTVQGTRLGTPGWMAPEQEQGRTDRIDARTDVFGLGVILRFLLGLYEGAPRPEALARPPARLRAIADHAAAPEQSARYVSVDELAADIRRFQDGLPVAAYHEPLHERIGRFITKYRTPILLVISYLIMRILIFAFTRP